MNTLGRINIYRRKIMQLLTRNVGAARFDKFNTALKPDIQRILISRPNGRLGNLLLITPLVQELTQAFPNSKIDLFVKGGLAPIIFKNYPNIDRIIRLPGKPFKQLLEYAKTWIRLRAKRYDIVLNVDKGSSSGRLSTKFSRSRHKFFGDIPDEIIAQYPDYIHMAKMPVYNLRNYIGRGQEAGNPVPVMDIRLNAEELADAKRVLHDLVGNDKKTICIFTFATGSKMYSEEWWNEMYSRLLLQFPEYNVVEILPKENVSQIRFKALSWYSTNIRQIAAFMANTEVFIGADSGMMHLASAAQIPVIGLFHITMKDKYVPYNGKSIGVDTDKISAEEIINLLAGMLPPK
ncbi:MAG TPA: glycosyltransferase family 9 protein [Flavobacterium sp.]|jgi:ADP-heptose:LPS heptosyltransferase